MSEPSVRSKRSSAKSASGRAISHYKTAVKYCRFENYQYDRETLSWDKPNPVARMCPNKDCKFVHLVERPEPCSEDLKCTDYNCTLLHSVKRHKPCRFGENCFKSDCAYNHPELRLAPCPLGADCYDHAALLGERLEKSCKLSHPHRMNRVCRYDISCRMFRCKFLHHPTAQGDCPDESNCKYQPGTDTIAEKLCSFKHPRYSATI